MDEYDEAIGSTIRSILLHATFDASDTEANFRFQAYQLGLEKKDRATLEAAMLGQADGAFYFRGLLASVDADDRSVANLILAVRGMEQFSRLLNAGL